MRILVAFDKFKDALTAAEACDIASRALRGTGRHWKIDACPLSDGGEGFVEILTRAAGGQRTAFQATGPRGGLVGASVGFVPYSRIPAPARDRLALDPPSFAGGTVAVVEMAAASGLALLPPELRDPWQTTTYGTGQLIRAAAESGAAAVLLGVGGSATHDLGLGALAALGFEFRAAGGGRLRLPVPAHWDRLGGIEGEVFAPIPPLRIACDVSNPLLGPDGAAAVFGPQKGLRAEDLLRLETLSESVAFRLCHACGRPASLTSVPGAGAAGGIAFGLMAGAGAQLIPGFELVSAWLDLDARMAAADIVITGEGRFDESSLGGKGPGAVAARARALGKPVHVFAGDTRGAADSFLHRITPEGTPLEQALREAPANLAAAITKVFT